MNLNKTKTKAPAASPISGFNRDNKSVFGPVSKEYERFREDYPKQLIDDLANSVKLSRKSKVLEIGCGTGKATIPFAKLGCTITALDFNQQILYESAKKTFYMRNVEYLNSSFEDADLKVDYFNMIFAAQSWHWVEPAVGYGKAARLLKEGGVFAVFWKYQDPDFKLRADMQKVYLKHCPDYPGTMHSTDYITRGISETGSFGKVEEREYHDNQKFTKADFLGLISTYSWVAKLEEPKRAMLFNDISKLTKNLKEPITVPYTYVLLMFRKTA
jgi:ubiquinone/menaquinone biosynthesis C-methylase UbiE